MRHRHRAACLVSLALLVFAVAVQADEPGAGARGGGPPRSLNVDQMAEWLRSIYSEAEFRALDPGQLAFESRQCSCYDQPTRHYPYQVVVLSTPRGDLILRPDQREMQVNFVKLAMRQGDRYCGVEPGSECFGEFLSVCHFTDFRYGAMLAPYFPTCKSETAD